MAGSASLREVFPARLRRGATTATVAIALATIALTAQQPAPFTSNTNLVVVPVVAIDSKGRTVADLTESDFDVFEDGTRVEVQTFLPPAASGVTGEDGRFLVIALDNLSTRPEIAFRVKAIATRFVDRLGARDVMTIISINHGNAVTTTSKEQLKSAISRFSPAFGDDTWAPGEKADHALRMISSLSEQVAKVPHRRKVVVFIGNPGLFGPSRPSAFADRDNEISPEWTNAVRETSRNNVSLYAINPEGLEGGAGDWSRSFAAETGGYAWSGTNNFSGAADQIFQESASYYLIGYAAPVNDRRLHKIDVKVARKGVTIRARKSRG